MSDTIKKQQDLAVVHRLQDIPDFGSEEEEHAFWATHALADDLWDQAEPLERDELPPSTRAQPIALRT